MVERSFTGHTVDVSRVAAVVLVSCICAEGVLFLLDILLNVAQLWYFEKFKQLSDVAREKSFGTWFSVVQNFAVALSALVLSLHYRKVLKRAGRSLGWLLVAAFFAYISLDDDLMLHERVGGTLGPILFSRWTRAAGTLPTYEWLFLLGPFFAAFGLFFLVFVWRELKSTHKRVLFVSGLCLWAVAQLLDAWEGSRNPYEWFLKTWGLKEMVVRHSFMLVEEVFEMLGSTFFLYVCLSHTADLYAKHQIVLTGSNPTGRAD